MARRRRRGGEIFAIIVVVRKMHVGVGLRTTGTGVIVVEDILDERRRSWTHAKSQKLNWIENQERTFAVIICGNSMIWHICGGIIGLGW